VQHLDRARAIRLAVAWNRCAMPPLRMNTLRKAFVRCAPPSRAPILPLAAELTFGLGGVVRIAIRPGLEAAGTLDRRASAPARSTASSTLSWRWAGPDLQHLQQRRALLRNAARSARSRATACAASAPSPPMTAPRQLEQERRQRNVGARMPVYRARAPAPRRVARAAPHVAVAKSQSWTISRSGASGAA
jgi:hypothetical protein